jgi:hypothetical protein
MSRSWRAAVSRSRRDGPVLIVRALLLGASIAAVSLAAGLIDSVLVRPTPVQDADQVVVVRRVPQGPNPTGSDQLVPFALYEDWARFSRLADGMGAAIRVTSRVPDRSGLVRLVQAEAITPGFFEVVGTSPTEGRLFDDSDGPAVCLISGSYRDREFGSSPMGQLIRTDQGVLEVVGVVPDAVARWRLADVWTPVEFATRCISRDVLASPGY